MYDLGKELEELLSKLQASSKASLHFIINRDPVSLSYSGQEILNLINLIVKYSDQQLSSDDDSIELQLVPFPEYVRVVVADTGEGLLPNSELFDLFPRGESTPSHLPLSIDPHLFKIVELARKLRTKVWVQSKWKMGTVFHIEIPYSLETTNILPFRKKDKSTSGNS